MFTGIIEAVGEIKQVRKLKAPQDNGLCLDVASGGLDLSDVAVGDSIAVNGVCLTVTALKEGLFSVDVSRETLNCTYGLDQPGEPVNLEKALRLSDRLGGHLVSGHVDSPGEVVGFDPVGESCLLTIKAPEPLLKYIVKKGSITVNGVSLTINQVVADKFSINLIPHTLAETTLNHLVPGSKVNLETDMLARYVARLINAAT
ncbi:MAG: riboflavin synthase [Nitrosomonas sp.]|nr:riboflavin synthase [Nitrosomonas sp.]MDP1951208.1 riboflavin synthase [Nitrosomonas sp.]